MSDIEQLTTQLVSEWNTAIHEYRVYQLDFSWPSLAVLELLVSDLADKTSFSTGDRDRLCGAAGYIGGLASHIWQKYQPKPEITLEVIQGPETTVILQATADSELFSLDLFGTLKKLLQEPPIEFNFFPLTSRILSTNVLRFSLFASGVVFGSSPFAKGMWCAPKQKLDDSKRHLVDAVLSESVAKHYSSRFPSEPIGQLASFYREGLVFPPAGHLEPFPYMRGSVTAIQRLIQRGTEAEQIRSLAENMTRIGDDIVGNVGLIILLALDAENPSAELLQRAQAKEEYLPVLWPAYNLVRQALGQNFNWAVFAAAGYHDKDEAKLDIAEQLLTQDYRLGFLPFLRLPAHLIRQERYLFLFNCLLWNKLKEALSYITELEKDDRSNALQLQKAFLLAKIGLRSQAKTVLEPLSRGDAAVYLECSALILDAETSPSLRVASLLPIINATDDPQLLSSVASSLLSILRLHPKDIAVREAIDTISKKEACFHSKLLMTQVQVLDGTTFAAKESIKGLHRIAPFHREVFSISMQQLSKT